MAQRRSLNGKLQKNNELFNQSTINIVSMNSYKLIAIGKLKGNDTLNVT